MNKSTIAYRIELLKENLEALEKSLQSEYLFVIKEDIKKMIKAKKRALKNYEKLLCV